MQPVAFVEKCVRETLRILRKRDVFKNVPLRVTITESVSSTATPDDYDHVFHYTITGKKENLLDVKGTVTLTDESASVAENYCTTITNALITKGIPINYALVPESPTTFVINYRFRAT